MCFTNVNDDAEWMATVDAECPWDPEVEPAFASLVGFNWTMIVIDILHAFHLGAGRDLIAGAIVHGIKCGVFGPKRTALARANADLLEFVETNKLSLRLKGLTRANLNYHARMYPSVACKGSDSTVLLKWLVSRLCEDSGVCPLVRTTLWAAHHWMRLLRTAGPFLDSEQAESCFQLGTLYIKTYMCLASRSVSRGETLWKIRPKTHLCHHLALCARSRISGRSFLDSNWMDEDYGKKITKILKKTHPKTSSRRALERYLLQLPFKMLLFE